MSAILSLTPARAEVSQLAVGKPACDSHSSCIAVLPAKSPIPAPISERGEESRSDKCVSLHLGGLQKPDADACEALISSGRGSPRQRATALVNISNWIRVKPSEILKPVLTLEVLDEAALEDPSFAEPHVARGNLAAEFDQLEEAVGHFDRALTLDPHHWRAMLGKARVLMSRQQANEALALARSAVNAAPDVSVAHQIFGDLLKKAGDLEGALIELREAASLYDGEFRRLPGVMQEPSPWAALAQVQMRLGRFERAIESISHEIDGKRENYSMAFDLLQRAEIYEKAGRADNAANDYEKAVALLGQGHQLADEYRARIAMLRASAGNSEAARSNFHDLIRSGKLQSILRIQVFLNNQGFSEVAIDGKSSKALEQALDRCLSDSDCSESFGRAI